MPLVFVYSCIDIWSTQIGNQIIKCFCWALIVRACICEALILCLPRFADTKICFMLDYHVNTKIPHFYRADVLIHPSTG